MSKKWFAVVGAMCTLLWGTAGHAQATVGFDPIAQTVASGATVDVGVVISGLTDGDAPSLSTFDLDISFDPSVLSFGSAVFGDPVLGDQLDVFGLGFNPTLDLVTGSGVLNIFELSLDSPDDLDTLQVGSFTLATLTFEALTGGTSPLGISINALGDAYGDPLAAEVTSGSVTVTGAAPEPATLALLGLGIAGMGYQRRRRLQA